MGNRCKTTIYSLLLLFSLSNCRDRSIGIDQMVECRLYWIEDTYPKDVGKITEKDMRLVCLHYIIINNTKENVFLPVKRFTSFEDDTTYCSRMRAYINNKPIPTWFSPDVRWNGILKPNDSIRAVLNIPEWVLDSAKLSKRIVLTELLKMLKVRYDRCLSDTAIFGSRIPQLLFTENDTIAIYYRDSKTDLDNAILCP